MTPDLSTFAKVRALHDSTTLQGERDAAAMKMRTLARKAGMTVDEAVSILDRQSAPQPKAPAQAASDDINAFFNSPEMRAQMAQREAERQARCRELLRRYGTEDAVFAETEREAALRQACAPLAVYDQRPGWEACYSLGGWSDIGGGSTMPAAVREAVTRGWPWPETVAAAWVEYEAADTLDSDRCAFEPNYTPHRWVEARGYVLEGVLNTHPARSLNDVRARLSWMEHMNGLQCQWTHDTDALRLATLRADIERMGAQLREERSAEKSAGVHDGQEGRDPRSPDPRASAGTPDGVGVAPHQVDIINSVHHGHSQGRAPRASPLRRTNAEKREAVRSLLGQGLADREVARRAGVSPQMVGNIRRAG